jgi:hypothetical protein
MKAAALPDPDQTAMIASGSLAFAGIRERSSWLNQALQPLRWPREVFFCSLLKKTSGSGVSGASAMTAGAASIAQSVARR